ncbi:nucleoside deaminase [Xylocopilactobacillus apicola]|uniref:tRNA-specific adenosine deaminase n=1 Tax=Xylocopilactobacillus apicola TaxID=2932184 RepID=A0AAU9D5F4_9LACO|nr:nucleoside deaminase [Xylocopilactobacillus apicola]BDR58723.1 tRNA-specific adenosine deaminase [Xylocopilactobacillus apicola]
MYNSKFMEIAAKEAESNLISQEGGPFGCVIVKDDQMIAKGHNEVLKSNDPSAHGEIVTIRKAGAKLETYDLSGCVLYTNAYPCPMCLSAIIWANIKIVYYGNTAIDADKIGFRDEFIYKFIENGLNDPGVLELEQHDHEKTIKSFEKYQDNDQVIY